MARHTFELEDDPNVALVSFRSALEETLRRLGEEYGLDPKLSVFGLLSELESRRILKADAVDGMADLVSLANRAAHGARVSPETLIPLRRKGSALLDGLEALTQNA